MSASSIGLKAGHRPLADQVALKLSHAGKEVKNQASLGSCYVHRVLKAAESDSPLDEVANDFDQVAESAAETVELPDHDHVVFPKLVENLKLRAIIFCPACGFDEDFLSASGLEGVYLQIDVLIQGADSSVAKYQALRKIV